MTILTALLAIGGLTTLLTTVLIVASRKLHVAEDPRLDIVEALLPHSNCGACGYPGCRAFAEALVAGSAQAVACTVSASPQHRQIAGVLGVDAGVARKRVARLACAGGDNVARRRADYIGVASCLAAAQVAGGGKECFWGCLGYGDCERLCDFDAISMSGNGLPVVDEDRCTACGDCVEGCPKDLFSLQTVDQPLWVRCKNEERGDAVLAACQVACTGCARCAVDAPGLVSMVDNLARVDYPGNGVSGPGQAGREAIERCPTGAIVWVDGTQGDIKGRESARVIRHAPRPQTVT